MKRKMLVADLLCGAGGSTTGAVRALLDLGFALEDVIVACVNHWPTAIETHRRNYPEARHYVQDIATARPHLIVPEGYLDLLMASPTCTHHSVARGGKPTSDQQRSDPWHIITWLTELRVKRIIIENVWEFIGWGPVDMRTGKPIKSRKGEYFHAWIETLKRLGFELEWRKLNAADYGDATTRSRFILMGRSDGRKISWPMPTHRKRGTEDGDLFGGMQPWRPAREIIDWQIKGRSIFNRKKNLAPKTLARIYAGAIKFGWPEPFIVVLRNHMAAQGLDAPLPTIAANGTHIGLAEPVIVSAAHGVDAGDPDPHSRRVKSMSDPLGAIHAGGKNFAIAEPVIMNGRKGNQAKGVSTEPVPTLDTKGGVWLAEPFVLSQASGGVARGVSYPIPTAPTGGAHALISPYYGSGSGETCVSSEEPLPTVTSKGRFGMAVPVTHSKSGNGARDVAEPIPTLTTAKGGEFAVVMPITHEGGHDRVQDVETPLPTITGANRGELAFITAQHGERPGQAPRVHDIDQPAPTIAATGHVDLVEATPEYDILFRMLEPHELAAAMGFNEEDRAYEFAGTKTEKIKQIGNAVSVAKMKACVSAIMADAAPQTKKPVASGFREAAE